ncbi:MAG: hypothetical protein H6740_07770 [Alphaproteobacteria bacterium]|nr:hypothetical protein [Alphaproteobacteria bacterium]
MKLRRVARALLSAARPRPASPEPRPPAPLQRWSAEAMGLPAPATVRCLLHLAPTGDLALGSDYGMVLWRDGHFLPFPFPDGARRESRRVEAMAVHEGALHVATATSSYTWPFHGQAAGRGRPSDGRGGFDDLRALHSSGGRLLRGWRTHIEGAEGPPECISFATAWAGRVFAGTLDGRLWELDVGEVRRFERGGRPRPVRHLAFFDDALWVAAAGQLHRFDGQTWTSREGEPTALHVDLEGTLWALEAGRLWRAERGGWPRAAELHLGRPWALGSEPGALWIGLKGGAARLEGQHRESVFLRPTSTK